MAVLCAATVSRSLQWKKDRLCWRQGHICQDQVEMPRHCLDAVAGWGASSASSSQVVWMKWQEIVPVVCNQSCGFPGALQFLVLVQQVLWLQQDLFYRASQEVTCGFLWLQLLLLGTTLMHKLVRTKSGLDCIWPVDLRRFLLQQMVAIFLPNIAELGIY